jgi:hypothetical protein
MPSFGEELGDWSDDMFKHWGGFQQIRDVWIDYGYLNAFWLV